MSLCSRSAVMILAVLAAPAGVLADDGRLRLAQAATPAPPTSGWTVPGATQQAAPAPPASGWSAPSAPAAAPSGPPAGGWSGSGSQRDCGGEFMPLRTDAEQKAAAIKAAAATKKQPAVCQAFKTFAAAEAKVIKYVEDYGAECRIPPDALKAMKTNHAKTIEVRTKVCDVAAAPAPRAPSLSDALGTSRVPTVPSDNAAAKRGSTFDTLTGNPLAR